MEHPHYIPVQHLAECCCVSIVVPLKALFLHPPAEQEFDSIDTGGSRDSQQQQMDWQPAPQIKLFQSEGDIQ